MTASNDNYQPIGLSSFFGGMSTDSKLGIKGQFYYGQHLDFRKNPSNFTVLPGTRETANGGVIDLVQAMDQIPSGARYALGDAGNLYQVATNGTWSILGNLSEAGGAGLVYRSDVDNVYFAGQNSVGRIQRVSTANTLQLNWFANGISNSTTCYKTGGTNAYGVTTAIFETTPNFRSFTTDIEPLYKLGIKVITKGTGNWTLTLHDDANNNLGSVTISNANVFNNQINYFVFSSPIRLQRGDSGAGEALTYHFHVSSTVADGTLATTTAGSMIDCDMELWANALVKTNNGLHPMGNFSNFTLIGNGPYVALYEPLQNNPTTSDFQRHRISLPPGFEVCGFAQKNLMYVIGAEKRSTTGNFQEGALFFWDGNATGYVDWWPVPEGSPESLFSQKNTVWFIADGALYEIKGTDEPIKVRTFRDTDSTYSSVADTTHSYPNMMTIRRGILLVGYPSTTTNQILEHGVYSYGAISREYPLSFGYSYTTSNGSILNNGSNNLRLGLVRNYGDTLFISWRDASASPHKYGVDVVDNTSSPAATFTIQPLVFDDERAYSYKRCGYIICTFDALPVGVTLTLKYKIDNDANWTYSTNTASAGDLFLVMPVDKPFLVLTFGLDGTCTTTTPNISSLFAFVDPLIDERPVGG